MTRNIFGLAFVASLAFVLLAATGASAITNGGIGGRPANPDPRNPRTQSIFVYTLNKGAVKEDAVNVINNTAEKQTIELYAVDGTISTDGAFTCEQRAESADGVGKWVSLAKQEVTLEPMQTEKVSMHIQVPQTLEVGEHNGCIVFQKKSDTGELRGGVHVQTRQALRMAITIPGNLHRDVTLRDFSVSQGASGRQYHMTVSNVGNVSVDAEVGVGLTDVFGRTVTLEKNNKATKSLGGTYSIVPASATTGGDAVGSLQLNFEENTKLFWGGFYKAQAFTRYNSDASSIGSKKGHPIAKYSEEITIFVMPSLLVILLLLIIILAITAAVAWLIGRRFDALRRKRTWQAYSVKPHDTIESVAKKYNIQWKKLARVNGIKAPYSLEPGSSISVPPKPTKQPKKD